MKNIFTKSLYVLSLVTMMSGCNGALEEEPRTFVSPDAYFNGGFDSYDLAVVGVYRTIRNTLGHGAWLTRESFSDIIGPVSGGYEQGTPVYQNNHQPFFYNVRDQWTNHYTIIKDANFIISQLGKANVLTDQQKISLSGEARLLRAYAYFQLVQLYGDVPVRTEPLPDYSDESLKIPRSPQAEVYKLIVDDLQFAESGLPENSVTIGRVNKWVATSLLAKVYLTMAGEPLKQTELYAKAKEKAVAVINSGKYNLVLDYAQVFHNTSYTTESIWEQTYQVGVGGNPLMQNSATAPGYNYIVTPATWFINSFPEGDRRKEWGIEQNFAAPSGTLAPFFNKFVNQIWLKEGRTTDYVGRLDFTVPLLRLAEMYLVAAEAENELNGPVAAYQYINAIRKRARINPAQATHVPDLSGLTKEAFRNAVLMERKWELHLEGSTWYDLKRTGTLNRIQTIRGNTLVNPIGDYNKTWYIPDIEIQNNNIQQNPFYK